MNSMPNHENINLSSSSTPSLSASNSNPYMDIHPTIPFPSYPGSSNPYNSMWMSRPSSSLNYPLSASIINRETNESCRPSCEGINYPPMNHPRPSEFESSPYQYIPGSIHHPTNYPSYNNYAYQQPPNNFHVIPPYNYNQTYLPDCRSYMPNMPVIDTRKMCPGLVPSQSAQHRDPMMEHNYARPCNFSNKITEPNINHSLINQYEGSKSLATVGNSTFNSVGKCDSSVSSSKHEDNGLIAEKPATRKRKSSAVTRELLLKPISLGFSRDICKYDNQAEDQSKKYILYTSPNGIKLNNRQELNLFLKANTDFELKSENFSFDSRLSLTPKTGNKINMARTIHSNGCVDLDNSFDDFVSTKSINIIKPRNEKSALDLNFSKQLTKSVKISTPTKITQTKVSRTILARHRKLIGKYFKKLSNDSKFYDGFACGSYRKKLPNLPKINLFPSIIQSKTSPEQLAIYGDVLCIFEFIHTFSSLFNLNLPLKPSIDELLNLLYLENSIDDYFCTIISILLKKILIFEKLANEIGVNYFIDNIYSLKWDWLIISEFLRIFIIRKSQVILDLHLFPDSYYHKNIEELIKNIKENSIFSLRPNLKVFCLRFLIDQLMNTNQSANIINEMIENIAQIRRDKFHLDTRIRQMKTKTTLDQITSATEVNAVKNESVNTTKLDESVSASVLNDEKSQLIAENSDHAPRDVLNSQNDEIIDLDKEKENMKISIKDALFSLRALYLGSDRYGREYYLPKNTNFICVESRSTVCLEGDSENIQLNDSKGEKPKFSPPTKLNDLLGVSEKLRQHLFPSNENMLSEIQILTHIATLLNKPCSILSLRDTASLQNMLINNPKFIKFVTEEDLLLFVDIYTRASIKHKKKAITLNEYDEGWWKIDKFSIISEYLKCLNQRGFRENHLLKSLNRNEEFINNLRPANEENIISNHSKEESSKNPKTIVPEIKYPVTSPECLNVEMESNKLVINELKTLSIKMDQYLSKIGIETETCLEKEFANYLEDPINDSLNLKQRITFLIGHFVSLCERKFDRPWLSKWNELLEAYHNTSSLYLLCHSLIMKIDPNSKLCHICEKLDGSLKIMECSSCLLTAHETCLSEPMRKYKKTKMICVDCLSETVAKATRICKICSIKTGKTILCANCKECFHIKCIQTKSTNKTDPILCEICTNLLDSSKNKFLKETIPDFPNVNFSKHYNECLEVLKILQESKDSESFRIPVSNDIPSYYEIIKQPMDFQTIEKKMIYKRYKKVHNFYNDIMLIFQNCRTFNEDNSKIAKSGIRLQKLFMKEWKKVCANF